MTWKNEYQTDQEEINGVQVHRFPVKNPRNEKKFNGFSEKVFMLHSTKEEEEEWMRLQGPESPELIAYLREHKETYDVFIFFTYLYYTTYFGLKEVAEKAILIPTAHDERPIYLSIFREMFRLPKGFFYNTKIEEAFIEKKFHVAGTLNNDGMGGVGVETPERISEQEIKNFRSKHRAESFMLYIGRIDEHKGCRELFQFFQEYKRRNHDHCKLLLMGKAVIDIPRSKDILSLGFVTEDEKFTGIAACDLLVLPSQFESLSMVVLEAMAMKRPVLVHENCAVVKEHCRISNGGLYYSDFYEFEACTKYLLAHKEEAEKMGENGASYVDRYYRWDEITKRLSEMIEKVSGMQGSAGS